MGILSRKSVWIFQGDCDIQALKFTFPLGYRHGAIEEYLV